MSDVIEGAVAAVLNRLDEMNGGGEISYEVYRELHDLASTIPDDAAPEWEWALMNDDDDEPWSHYYESRELLLSNLEALAGRDDETLVRRRKAGPWEPLPVGGETDE